MNSLTYLKECQPIKMALIQNAVKDIPQLSIVESLMNTPQPPLEMGHSLTSPTHHITIFSTMLLLCMMQPILQPLPKKECMCSCRCPGFHQ